MFILTYISAAPLPPMPGWFLEQALVLTGQARDVISHTW